MADVLVESSGTRMSAFRIQYELIMEAAMSGNKQQVFADMNRFIDYLKFAEEQTSGDLMLLGDEPPSEARAFHLLMIESLQNAQTAFVSGRGFCSQIINLGYINRDLAERADECILAADRLRLQAKWELDELKQKVKKR